MKIHELSIKMCEECEDGEIVVPMDPTTAMALLATLAHMVAGSVGVSDARLLEILSASMLEEESK